MNYQGGCIAIKDVMLSKIFYQELFRLANLRERKDHYPKYVVTLDELAAGNVDGVKIIHMADFLLAKKY